MMMEWKRSVSLVMLAVSVVACASAADGEAGGGVVATQEDAGGDGDQAPASDDEVQSPTAGSVDAPLDPADEPSDEPDDVDVEVVDVEDGVRAALTDFFVLLDDFDHGDATAQQVADRLTGEAAAAADAGEASWVAWDGTPEGRRTLHDISVTMHDDDAGSFTMCVEDVRETRDTAPNGVYYLNSGRLVHDGDGWLVDVFFDPVKDSAFARPGCVPNDVAEELHQIMRDLNDAWWRFTAQDTYPWTEDMFQDNYLAAGYYGFVDQGLLERLRDAGYFRTGEAVRTSIIDPDRWPVVPGIVPVLRCDAPTRMWVNDLETGEIVEELDLPQDILDGNFRVGVWTYMEDGEFAGLWIEGDVADYGDGMDICGNVENFEHVEF